MADKAASPVAVEATPASTKKETVGKKAIKAKKPTHPPTSEMVNAAITNLKERNGSSLQAIKKYITATYKVDGEKLAPFIRKYLKAAVTIGNLVQTKGKGASGSFKLPMGKTAGGKAKTEGAAKKTSVRKKPTRRQTPQVTKKATPTKKAPAAKKTLAAKRPASAAPAAATTSPAKKVKVNPPAPKSKAAVKSAKPKTMAKTKKAPAAKPKAPKPKKAGTTSKAAKTAPKKK